VFHGPLSGHGPSCRPAHVSCTHWEWGIFIDNGFKHEGYQTTGRCSTSSADLDLAKAQAACTARGDSVSVALLEPGSGPRTRERANREEGFEEGRGLGKNKVSFVGHGIGLAIDEYPAVAKGFDLPLEEGTVLAIEPKIGLPGIGMVGVENTFVVTPQGGKSLTGEQYEIICVKV
jgi:hypothetical protein